MSDTRVVRGATDPCDWKEDDGDLVIDVDTSGNGFSETPTFICSLVGESHHWSTTGGSCVVDPKPSGFRVRVRNALGTVAGGSVQYRPLERGTARQHLWRINWIALEANE